MTVLAILILVIFGPDRMPELARKAGTMLAKARDTARVLREDLGSEYKEILEPIEDVRKTLKEARSEIRGIASDVAQQVGAVVDDVKAEVNAVTSEAKSSVDEALAEARKAVELDKPVSPGGPGDVLAEEAEPVADATEQVLDDTKPEPDVVADQEELSVDEALAEARKAVELDKPVSPGGPGDVLADATEQVLDDTKPEPDDSDGATDGTVGPPNGVTESRERNGDSDTDHTDSAP